MSTPMPRSVEDAMPADVTDSSRGVPWPGLELMTARIAHDELEIDGLQTHTLAINIGRRFRVDGRIDGHAVSGEMHPGTMKLIEAGPRSMWFWDAGPPIEMLHLSVTDEIVRASAHELELAGAPQIRSRVGFVDERLVRLGYALAAERHGAPAGSLVADALRVELLTCILADHSSAPAAAIRIPAGRIGLRALRSIDAYVDAHLGSAIRLDDLAALAGMSRFHFGRVFRTTVGTTPHRYVLERRLARARVLLQSTTLAVRDVAVVTGFADQSHLTRLVKRRFGITPAALRAR